MATYPKGWKYNKNTCRYEKDNPIRLSIEVQEEPTASMQITWETDGQKYRFPHPVRYESGKAKESLHLVMGVVDSWSRAAYGNAEYQLGLTLELIERGLNISKPTREKSEQKFFAHIQLHRWEGEETFEKVVRASQPCDVAFLVNIHENPEDDFSGVVAKSDDVSPDDLAHIATAIVRQLFYMPRVIKELGEEWPEPTADLVDSG